MDFELDGGEMYPAFLHLTAEGVEEAEGYRDAAASGGRGYGDLARRLTPEATELLRTMVAAHLEAGFGERRFLLIRHGRGADLIFLGSSGKRLGATPRASWKSVDVGALQDLHAHGLLHLSYDQQNDPNYHVTGDGVALYRWLMEEHGAALAQTEAEVRHVIDAAAFTSAHPGAAHHLHEAFRLLWAGRTDDQVVSEIGDHLRKALMDATTDLLAPGDPEHPDQRLRAWLDKLTVPKREREVLVQLVELARVTLRLDHRLNHIRDEADRGRPAATWEETRRAAFITSLVCYELDRLRPPR